MPDNLTTSTLNAKKREKNLLCRISDVEHGPVNSNFNGTPYFTVETRTATEKKMYSNCLTSECTFFPSVVLCLAVISSVLVRHIWTGHRNNICRPIQFLFFTCGAEFLMRFSVAQWILHIRARFTSWMRAGMCDVCVREREERTLSKYSQQKIMVSMMKFVQRRFAIGGQIFNQKMHARMKCVMQWMICM